jgi:hypothetical protein
MSMTVDILKNYPNEVFVETGTYKGDGVQMALDCGFKMIYSFEACDELALLAGKRFMADKRVAIFRADSRENIKHIIQHIDCPITFWLDAHSCGDAYFENGNGGYYAIPTYQDKSSVLMELEQINRHPIKNHTILIDDWTIFGTRELETKIWSMGYNTKYIDGTRKNDILIATK